MLQRLHGPGRLPALHSWPLDLASEVLPCGGTRSLPRADEPALAPDSERLDALERACDRIASMFWGERIPVAECCSIIRDWIRRNFG